MALTALWAGAMALALVAAPLAPRGAQAETPAERAALEAAASAGDQDAMLRLGTIHDFGLGVPRDPSRAMRWFLQAADAGSEVAMFNIGALLDFGVGRDGRDATAAAVWYGRAALRGHERARYNLGLLYESGEGVPWNPAQARLWFDSVAPSIPDAKRRRAALAEAPTADLAVQAPTLSFATLHGTDVELVWSAAPGPQGLVYRIELRTLSGTDAPQTLAVETDRSVARLSLPSPPSQAWVRIVALDRRGAAYAASPWTSLRGTGPTPDVAQVRVILAADDADSHRLAAQLARDLAANRMGVTLVETPTPAVPETQVTYGFAADRRLAEQLAAFLPGPVRAVQVAPTDTSLPNQITVALVGGATVLASFGQ